MGSQARFTMPAGSRAARDTRQPQPQLLGTSLAMRLGRGWAQLSMAHSPWLGRAGLWEAGDQPCWGILGAGAHGTKGLVWGSVLWAGWGGDLWKAGLRYLGSWTVFQTYEHLNYILFIAAQPKAVIQTDAELLTQKSLVLPLLKGEWTGELPAHI